MDNFQAFIRLLNTLPLWREWKMTVVEQRKHSRHVLGRQAPGKFRLLTPAAAYPIAVIRDISGSGIRVFLDACLAERLDVVVEYTELTLKLEMQGRVAWCTEQAHGAEATKSAGRYVVGIELFSPFLFMSMAGLY
jgi:PilZ domain